VLDSDVFYPKDLAAALDLLRKRPGALIMAGGTDILREQGGRAISLPAEVVCVHEIPELRRAGLTERFLEIGAAVTLTEVLELGESVVPTLLAEAVGLVGNPAVRNLATIGGNVACKERFMDAWPALACLDAIVELRDAGGSTWINVNRLVGEDRRPAFPEGGLLTRIRIPLDRWDARVVKKVGAKDYPSPETAVFAFAAKVEKGLLSEIRLAFAGETAFRSPAAEARLIGRTVPLSERERSDAAQSFRDEASFMPEPQALRFGILVDGALELLGR
jgi:CO/xanthine dehydrogenase FAD-binding subunit